MGALAQLPYSTYRISTLQRLSIYDIEEADMNFFLAPLVCPAPWQGLLSLQYLELVHASMPSFPLPIVELIGPTHLIIQVSPLPPPPRF